MPRPKDDDSWIGRPEHVQGRGVGSEGDGHERRGMPVEPEAAVQEQAQEALPVRRRKSTAPSARSSRWDRVEVWPAYFKL